MTRGRTVALRGAYGSKIDYVAALLGVRATTARDWPRLPADVRALFTAYAAGLNHYADKPPDEVRLSGLFPATGEDVVAGVALRSPFFFGHDTGLGELTESRPLSTAGGTPIAVTCKNVTTPRTPTVSDQGEKRFERPRDRQECG